VRGGGWVLADVTHHRTPPHASVTCKPVD
jgi:hypothetical protein